jgi:hypothetical protein
VHHEAHRQAYDLERPPSSDVRLRIVRSEHELPVSAQRGFHVGPPACAEGVDEMPGGTRRSARPRADTPSRAVDLHDDSPTADPDTRTTQIAPDLRWIRKVAEGGASKNDRKDPTPTTSPRWRRRRLFASPHSCSRRLPAGRSSAPT